MSDRVGRIVDSMTIEQKAGQLLVLGFSGSFAHRDVLESVERYHPAGFRLTPHARKFSAYLDSSHPASVRVNRDPESHERVYTTSMSEPRMTVEECAEALNRVRQRSLETGAGIPVYFGHDQEGNYNADTLDQTMVAFPHYMGIACTGDTALARRIGYVTGRQLKAAGVDIVHGPVVDVNTEPENPEIETRSFSPLVGDVCEYALPVMQGIIDGGCIPVAKHFPGRGASRSDAHYSVPLITESRQRLWDVHLAPYRHLIAHGLPAIMMAHSVYPSLDPSEEISTVSRIIATDLLRGELGFGGVLISDSFTMAGLIVKYDVAEGVIRAVDAGIDLVLMKDENALRGEVHAALVKAIRSGRLREERVNESVGRVLAMKERFGMLDGRRGVVDVGELREVCGDPRNREVAIDAARKCTVLLRDREHLIPLPGKAKILVCEEPFGLQTEQNNSVAYCGALYHQLLDNGCDALFADFSSGAIEKSWPLIEARAALVDTLVVTGYTKRGKPCPRQSYERFLSLGKPVIFVANSPYEKLVPPQMGTVLVTFHSAAVSSRAAADIITGKLQATGTLRFDPTRIY